MPTATEVCHAIKRDTKSDITRIREIFPVLGLAVDHDLPVKEVVVDGGVEDVLDDLVTVTGAGIVVAVPQLFRDRLIAQHHFELIFHRQVLKLFDWDSGAFVPGLFAIRAGAETRIGPGEAAATTRTTVNSSRF